MTKTAPHNSDAAIPTLSTPMPEPQGEGSGEMCKTTIQQKPGKKPNWRCGAPAGNRNAVKPVPALSTLKRRVRALKRRAEAAIAQVPK